MGSASSAFHTKIFGSSAQLVCLNLWPKINSNYALIDLVSKDRIAFLYPEILERNAMGSKFMESANISNPKAVAEDLMQIISSASQL